MLVLLTFEAYCDHCYCQRCMPMPKWGSGWSKQFGQLYSLCV